MINTEKLKQVERLILGKGSHSSMEAGACVLEAVSFVAGEPWSDHPECASRVIGAFMRTWNDDLDDAGRQKLKPYIVKLVGTKASAAIENKRAWLITDWLVRHHTPAWLDLAGCTEQAAALRSLPEIDSAASAKSAQPKIKDASDRAYAAMTAAWAAAWAASGDAWAASGDAGDVAMAAAWAAAGDVAWDAAKDVAMAAAWAAAGDVAWDAAKDAARAAAGAAAGDVAWDAARAAAGAAAKDAATTAAMTAAGDVARAAAKKKLAPTVTSLQASAFDLLDRLIAMSDKP
jgi:hypothetical protein